MNVRIANIAGAIAIAAGAVVGLAGCGRWGNYHINYVVYSDDPSVVKARVNDEMEYIPYSKQREYNDGITDHPLLVVATAQDKTLHCQIFVDNKLKVEKTGKSFVKCQYIWTEKDL